MLLKTAAASIYIVRVSRSKAQIFMAQAKSSSEKAPVMSLKSDNDDFLIDDELWLKINPAAAKSARQRKNADAKILLGFMFLFVFTIGTAMFLLYQKCDNMCVMMVVSNRTHLEEKWTENCWKALRMTVYMQ